MRTEPNPARELIDRLTQEGLRGFAEVRRIFGSFRGGKPVAPATLWRWHFDGVKLRDGRRVYLEAIKCGGKFMTSEPACARFLEAQNEPMQTSAQAAKVPSPGSGRDRAHAAAKRKLAAAGC